MKLNYKIIVKIYVTYNKEELNCILQVERGDHRMKKIPLFFKQHRAAPTTSVIFVVYIKMNVSVCRQWKNLKLIYQK